MACSGVADHVDVNGRHEALTPVECIKIVELVDQFDLSTGDSNDHHLGLVEIYCGFVRLCFEQLIGVEAYRELWNDHMRSL